MHRRAQSWSRAVSARWLLRPAILILAASAWITAASHRAIAQQPTPTPVPTPTPTPTTADRIEEFSSAWGDAFTALLTMAGAAALLVLVVIAVLILLIRTRFFIRLFRRPAELVVSDFVNASGDDTLDTSVAGLSVFAREELTRAIEQFHTHVKASIQGVGPDTEPTQSPLPTSTPDQTIDDLVESVASISPSQLTPIARFVNLVTPRQHTEVICTLQRTGDTAGRFGITVEVADMSRRHPPAQFTVWEQRDNVVHHDASDSGASTNPNVSGSRSDSGSAFHLRLLRGAYKLVLRVAKLVVARFRKAPAPAPPAAPAEYVLGEVYEQHGAHERARAHYEAALQKQPTHAGARAGLDRVLRRELTPVKRYMALLEPVNRWLVIELGRREMLDHPPAVVRFTLRDRDARVRAYRSQVYNFFGALSHASEEHGTFFLRHAVRDYRRAIDSCADWYQPYENLAEAYRQMDQLNMLHHGDALAEYDTALANLDNDARFIAGSTERRAHTQRRIRIGKATAQLASGDAALVMAGYNSIASIESDWKSIHSEKDARILYYLAIGFAAAARVHDRLPATKRDLERKARRYLVFSAVRDPDYLWESEKDPSLNQIVNLDHRETLEQAIRREERRSRVTGAPDPKERSGDDFRATVDRLIEDTGWT